MPMMRRRVLATLAALPAASVFSPAFGQASAGNYPNAPIKVVLNYSPGGPTDVVARAVGTKMADILGQPFVIDNKPSMNGVIGTNFLSRSAPDGYTIMLSTTGQTSVAQALFGEKLGFDPIKDMVPIGRIVNSTQMMVAYPGLGVKTVAELVALAKSKPGVLNVGSVGVGSSPHLGMELFKSMAGVDMVHVPYKGTAQVMNDLLAGRISVMLNSMGTVYQHVQAGKLVALAVATPTRSPVAPDVPTMEELGYKGFQVPTWYAFFAPNKTPDAILAKLNGALNQALADPGVVKTLALQSFEAAPGPANVVTRLIQEDYARWKKVVTDAKIVAE